MPLLLFVTPEAVNHRPDHVDAIGTDHRCVADGGLLYKQQLFERIPFLTAIDFRPLCREQLMLAQHLLPVDVVLLLDLQPELSLAGDASGQTRSRKLPYLLAPGVVVGGILQLE